MKWYHWIFLLLILTIYSITRFGWHNTIEFGYDQPRLATSIREFMDHGSYLSSQQFSLPTPWENLSWGPFLIFFLSIFLRLSPDPIINSLSIAFFNVGSILIVFYLGKRYFSTGAGLVACLIFATHPWWVIFSRMFYQPSTTPTFVALSMLLTLLVIQGRSKFFLSLLIVVWTFLVQSYLMSLSIIFTSALFLIPKVKLSWIKWIILGGLMSSVFLIPEFLYFTKHVNLFNFFIKAPGKYTTDIMDIFSSYFNVVGGSNWLWQLGNGYEDFLILYPFTKTFFLVGIVFVAIVFIFNIFMLFRSNDWYRRLLVIFWAIAPAIFIYLVKVEFLVPRYFLIALPAVSLLAGICISDLIKLVNNKFSNSIYLLPIGISGMWLVFILCYYNFFGNYKYPRGFLSLHSDTTYLSISKSIEWVKSDAEKNGKKNFNVISDSDAVNYYLRYVDSSIGHDSASPDYNITYWNPDPEKPYANRFGPMTIYRVD